MKEKQELTPKQIVEELDKYIVGQDKAKRAVASALRNRCAARSHSSTAGWPSVKGISDAVCVSIAPSM